VVSDFFVLTKSLSLPGNRVVRIGQGVGMKKPISGQFKVNLDTGQVSIVGSKASDKPVKEQQASLLLWGEDKVKLEWWEKDAKDKGCYRGAPPPTPPGLAYRRAPGSIRSLYRIFKQKELNSWASRPARW
jgi:hypothetical protein